MVSAAPSAPNRSRGRQETAAPGVRRARDGVEEADAARAAQILPRRRSQQIAADRADIDRQLADRLTRVEQEGHACRARDAPDRGRRVHQPASHRDVGESDELHAFVQCALQRLDRDLSRVIVGDHLDRCSRAFADLGHRDVVAAVFGPAGDDPVAFAERYRIERHVPRPGRVLDDRDPGRPSNFGSWGRLKTRTPEPIATPSRRLPCSRIALIRALAVRAFARTSGVFPCAFSPSSSERTGATRNTSSSSTPSAAG